MMTITQPQAELLATLALACRPHGSRHWDAAGIVANIGKVRHLALADVAMATIRAAANAKLDSPGAIANTTSEVWRERVTPIQPQTPPTKDEMCVIHGGHADGCHGCAADALAGDKTTRPSEAAAPTDTYLDARKASKR